MANSTHGVTKVDMAHLETYKAITAPSDVAGVPFESLERLEEREAPAGLRRQVRPGAQRLQRRDGSQDRRPAVSLEVRFVRLTLAALLLIPIAAAASVSIQYEDGAFKVVGLAVAPKDNSGIHRYHRTRQPAFVRHLLR